jgi:hypothetical protein
VSSSPDVYEPVALVVMTFQPAHCSLRRVLETAVRGATPETVAAFRVSGAYAARVPEQTRAAATHTRTHKNAHTSLDACDVRSLAGVFFCCCIPLIVLSSPACVPARS